MGINPKPTADPQSTHKLNRRSHHLQSLRREPACPDSCGILRMEMNSSYVSRGHTGAGWLLKGFKGPLCNVLLIPCHRASPSAHYDNDDNATTTHHTSIIEHCIKYNSHIRELDESSWRRLVVVVWGCDCCLLAQKVQQFHLQPIFAIATNRHVLDHHGPWFVFRILR